MPNPENPLVLDTDAARRALADVDALRALTGDGRIAWCPTPGILELEERVHRTDMVPLLRAALGEVERLRICLATAGAPPVDKAHTYTSRFGPGDRVRCRGYERTVMSVVFGPGSAISYIVEVPAFWSYMVPDSDVEPA